MSSIFQRIVQVQTHVQNDMMHKNNVVGVGVGYKESRGVITDQLAMVVMVEEKKSVRELDGADLIPNEVGGIRTDVYEVGKLVAQADPAPPNSRFRPIIPCGASIGHYQITAGTLGVIVRDRTTGERLILSNNHVLANGNKAAKGDAVLQPGPSDNGQMPGDVVAHLERFIPLAFIGDPPPDPSSDDPTPADPDTPTPRPGEQAGCLSVLIGLSKLLGDTRTTLPRSSTIATANAASETDIPFPTPLMTIHAASTTTITTNLMDCALARPVDTTMFSDQILGIGVVRNYRSPELGMQIRKSGRTTGLTQSIVTLLNATVDVGYEGRTARFVEQVICEPMSKGGDSGSLVVDSDNNAVGLLFAGSNLATLFTPIDVVLQALNVMFG